MSWVKIDDGAPDHPKQLAAGAEACWLWVCGLAYCNRQTKRDGFIPELKVGVLYPVKNAGKLAERLVEVRLWERADGGYRIHDYLEFQPSLDLRAARAEAGREGGRRSGESRRSKLEAKAKQLGLTKPAIDSNPDPDPDPDPVPADPPNPPPGGGLPPEVPAVERPSDVRLRNAGLAGMEGSAWADGIRRGTGQPVTEPPWRDHARIAAVLAKHAPNLRGQAALDWVTGCAESYARDTKERRTFATIGVLDWERWQNTNPWQPAPTPAEVAGADDDPDYPDPKKLTPAELAERRRLAEQLDAAIGAVH